MNSVLTRLPASSGTASGTQAARLRVRRVAMSLSVVIAALYGLIAGNVVTVLAGPAEQVARDQFDFALPAAGIYVVGAVLLWRFDRRLFWVGGTVLQLLVIAMYFAVSPQRDPTFEIWGMAIRVLQILLLAALAYLATRPDGGPDAVDRETRRLPDL